MSAVTPDTVQAYFDAEVVKGRELLPDPSTVSGLGRYRKYERAASLMADPAVRHVLDVGCNRGSIEFLFHQQHPDEATRTRVDGIDVSDEAVRRAHALGLPNCDFRSYDGDALPYESESFDLVVMVEVIEHVVEKERLLREAWRVLKPNGKLYLTTPNPQCLPLQAELGIWSVLRRLFRRPKPAKDIFIDAKELALLLEAVRFENIDRQSFFEWPHLFVHSLGWSLLPPLPPRALYWYQQRCLRRFDRRDTSEFLAKRFKWSLVALVSKPAIPPREAPLG